MGCQRWAEEGPQHSHAWQSRATTRATSVTTESRFRVERDGKRHSERVSLPLAYTRASHGKSEAAPATVLLLFLFSLFFFGHYCDKEKVAVQTIGRASFSFFWEGGGRGGGRETGLNPCAQITEGKKNLIF